MIIINELNTQRFSLNGIPYLKNYITHISGNLIEIFNCYERCDVLLPPTHYNQFRVNGAEHFTIGQLQAALADVLYARTTLGTAAADIDQDNVDLVRKYRISAYSLANVLNAINTGPTFSINDRQSVWFVIAVSFNLATYKFKMIGLGKGDYGAGGTAISSENIELVYSKKTQLADIRQDNSTQFIQFGSISNMKITDWLNSQPTALSIQPAEIGNTIFSGTINNALTEILWQGEPGTYGATARLARDNDFTKIADVDPSVAQVDYDTVLGLNNESSSYAVHLDNQSKAQTAYGITLKHVGVLGKQTSVAFTEPVEDTLLTIPATVNNDEFALRSDFHKEVKVITTATEGFTDDIYTLQAEDKNKWLSFDMEADFYVMVPPYFAANTLIEGDVANFGQANFIAVESITLQYGISENPKTAEKNSVFGLKFRSAENVLLFGKLDVL